MNSDQREKLQAAMQQRMGELDEEIRLLKLRATPVAPDNAIGRLTRMDEIVNQGVNQTALTGAIALRAKLDRAYSRSDSDEFGECESCLAAIPVERLLVVPEASLCVLCQQKSEES